MSIIVTCNAGSSNNKLAAFDSKTLERKGHAVVHSGAEATEWLCSIGTMEIAAMGHRIVHGGREFQHPGLITDSIVERLHTYASLAPLHQLKALTLLENARRLYPNIPHIACFDTAFHATLPAVERRIPLPRWYHDEGIQRYGFHGLSYQHIADVLPNHTKAKRVIVAHLGGGSSACAMLDRKSIATTMGFSTLDGMMMGTRTGAIDASVVVHLVNQLEMKLSEVQGLLYYESGLRGVSGISDDMRVLLASNEPAAQEAIELYCYLAAKHIAGLVPALGGLDALVFTGGIGENAASIRDNISTRLKALGDFPIHIIPTDEERVITQACKAYI